MLMVQPKHLLVVQLIVVVHLDTCLQQQQHGILIIQLLPYHVQEVVVQRHGQVIPLLLQVKQQLVPKYINIIIVQPLMLMVQLKHLHVLLHIVVLPLDMHLQQQQHGTLITQLQQLHVQEVVVQQSGLAILQPMQFLVQHVHQLIHIITKQPLV